MSDSENDAYLSRLENKLDRILNIVETMDDKFRDHEERLRSLETYIGHQNLKVGSGFWSRVGSFFTRDPLGSTAALVLTIVGVVYVIHNLVL
jgi:hypothetical protein